MSSMAAAGVSLELRSWAAKWRFSRTVSRGWTMSSCGTKPKVGRKLVGFTSASLKNTLPVLLPYVALPASTFMKVVLPAPEGPMMATRWLRCTSPVTPSSTLLPSFSRSPSSWKRMDTEEPAGRMPRNWCVLTLCEGMKRRPTATPRSWAVATASMRCERRCWARRQRTCARCSRRTSENTARVTAKGTLCSLMKTTVLGFAVSGQDGRPAAATISLVV
mmetsp:Transcript_70013/g.195382  ORF Transcript_70013/g.195382 Transcript_70013/m.195382 type:complete len:219 (+) Transcript_70013:931-1587(+)